MEGGVLYARWLFQYPMRSVGVRFGVPSVMFEAKLAGDGNVSF